MPNKTASIGIGIIGCGRITEERHAPEYAACQGAEIVGYFDFVRERAEALAKRYGGEVFSSIEEMLACKAIGAVSVCTANATHARISIDALRAGKHVLCEKPMATTPEECEAMLAEAKRADRRLMIAHNQRFFPVHRKARELVAAGAIGRVLRAATVFGHSGPDNWSVDRGTGNWFFDKTKSAFGATADLGVHKIDLVRYLLGEEIVGVTAMLGTLDKRDAAGNPVSVDDNAAAIYRMASGAIATVTASWTYYGEEENGTSLYGTEGQMRISPAEGRITLRTREGDEKILDGLTAEHSGVMEEFVGAILAEAPSVLDAEAVIPSMTALFATVKAASEGVCIPVM